MLSLAPAIRFLPQTNVAVQSLLARTVLTKMEAPPMPTRRPPKRLLFDRRYGWVFDEWKDPSEEALAGGRGMFCILPITKSLLKTASQLMIGVSASTVKALENPSQFTSAVARKFNQPAHPVPEINASHSETLPQVVSLPQGFSRTSCRTLKL